MEQVDIGIIGGSGFYQIKSIENSHFLDLDTPFGRPSDKLLVGRVKDKKVAFLNRHGVGHCLGPAEVNYRANIFALKMLGVKYVISISAVGSLKEELHPTDLVIPDQFFDSTCKREKTFFENGLVAHVAMAEPTCPNLSKTAFKIARELGLNVHLGGTYYNMEGPQFSTKAESFCYRQLGFSIIGMTQAVEAKLAKEAEMCFLSLAFVTDYDCWHHEEETVSVEMIVKNFNKNNENASRLVEHLILHPFTDEAKCPCQNALANNIITHPDSIPQAIKIKLRPLIAKYIQIDE